MPLQNLSGRRHIIFILYSECHSSECYLLRARRPGYERISVFSSLVLHGVDIYDGSGI